MKNSSGFTLIEMIVAIAVLAASVSVGYTAFQKFNSDKDLNLTAEDFQNALYLAKSYSQSSVGYKTYCQPSGWSFVGYRVIVNIVSNPSTYNVKIVCVDDSGVLHVPTNIIRSGKVPTSLSVTPYVNGAQATTANIQFNYPGGNLDSTYSATFMKTGATTDGGKEVDIDANGTIFMQSL